MLTLGQDLCAVLGDQNRVLELRVEAAVHRDGGPAVVPHGALRAPHGQSRLCSRITTNQTVKSVHAAFIRKHTQLFRRQSHDIY